MIAPFVNDKAPEETKEVRQNVWQPFDATAVQGSSSDGTTVGCVEGIAVEGTALGSTEGRPDAQPI